MATAAAALLAVALMTLTCPDPIRALMPPEWNLPGLPPAWGAGASGNHRCVPIPSSIQLCAGIGYSEMRLPNMLNHESPKEVQDQTNHWVPLVNTYCHREIRVLLCSIYAPVCIKRLPEKSIKPCRTLCQAVKDSCLAIMEKFGFAWPDMLNCAQFPPEHDLMCIKRSVSLSSTAARSNSCQICAREPTYESLISGYCMNDVVFKARVDKIPVATAAAIADPSSAPRQAVLPVQFKGKLRFFSAGRLQAKRDRRQLTSGQLTCATGDCPMLDEAAANPKRRYLVMGTLRPDSVSLEVKLLVEWNQRQPAFRKAIRSIRRDSRQQQPKERGLCRGGQRLLHIQPSSGGVGGGSSGGSGAGVGSSGVSSGGAPAGGSGVSVDGGADGRQRKKRKGGKKKDRRRAGGAVKTEAASVAGSPASLARASADLES